VSQVQLCRCRARYRDSRFASCCAFRPLPRAAAAGCRVFEQLAWCRSNTWTSKYEAKTEEQDEVKFGPSLLTRFVPLFHTLFVYVSERQHGEQWWQAKLYLEQHLTRSVQGMSGSQPVQKQRNYAQLASRLNDFKNTTSEYEKLLDKLANQHKALSDMGAWHAAQYERDFHILRTT